MIESESTAYETFCKGQERRWGYGMAAFAKTRKPPYVASTLLEKKRLNDRRRILKVSAKELTTAKVSLTTEALTAYGQLRAAKKQAKKQAESATKIEAKKRPRPQ